MWMHIPHATYLLAAVFREATEQHHRTPLIRSVARVSDGDLRMRFVMTFNQPLPPHFEMSEECFVIQRAKYESILGFGINIFENQLPMLDVQNRSDIQ